MRPATNTQCAFAEERRCSPAHTSDRALFDRGLGDLRFRNLLPPEDWNALPHNIRRRFSCRLAPGETVVYVGEVREVRMNFAGRVVAQVARLIGAPLPRSTQCTGPSVVAVTEDETTGGQMWTRLYARPGRFPQVIRSAKLFSGPTGLEEYLGCGVGMALRVRACGDSLQFLSAGFFIRIGSARIALPIWLTPGTLTVTHADLGDGCFTFTLELSHPLLGELIRQTAIFRDAEKSPAEGVSLFNRPAQECSGKRM
jgi:hypothetical protein